MALQTASGSRAAKLTTLFWAFAKGQRKITNSLHAKQFLEASNVFCQQNSAVKFVEVVISTSDGIKALESSVRTVIDPGFLASSTLPFLKNLSDPSIEALSDGNFLKQIVLAILVPKTFWTALLDAHHCGVLDDASSEVFAWLCLQIVSSRDTSLEEHISDVRAIMNGTSLLEHSSHDVRTVAYRIKKVLQIFAPIAVGGIANGPGGRHDNDFEDFRDVVIYPTTDELLSSEEPFLQRLDDVFDTPMDERPKVYRDWLYRLLREDMLAELREDLQVAMGQKRGRRKPTPLCDLSYATLEEKNETRVEPFTLYLTCGIDSKLGKSEQAEKRLIERLKDSLQRQPIGALCCGTTIIAFGSLIRKMEQVKKSPPVVGIKFKDSEGLKRALVAFSGPKRDHLKFFTVDTAMFAYEPILQRLKDMGDLPLENHIVDPEDPEENYNPPLKLQHFIEKLKTCFKSGVKARIPSDICTQDIRLEGAQLKSLIHGLSEEVSQVQGPPGTGKSFLGALIILIILRLTNLKVLVLAYTNHATDQFMEDLMEIGVGVDDMVRLGSKSTQRTERVLLKNLARDSTLRTTYEEWNVINARKKEASEKAKELQRIGAKLSQKDVQPEDILEYLEFSDDYSSYWHAFQIPESGDGYKVVNAENRALQPEDLLMEWTQPSQRGNLRAFVQSLDHCSTSVWEIPLEERSNLRMKWSQDIREEQISEFVRLSECAHQLQDKINSIFAERNRRVLKSKRIIACTTTAAAMYQSIINTANPDIIMVEEAGEILEAHIITAMSPSVKQLILIGDHKQLRPKVKNYKLTKEKGEGYDLNVSLFERLVLQGHNYTTLQEQHRSHPDISRFARMLAYEELEDAPKTLDREPIRGLRNRVTFVHHEHHEDKGSSGDDWDLAVRASKQNKYEAQMVLKLVRYLGQQGYASDKLVVLTPYLGQLSLLKDMLRGENDPYLNDLDSHDLVRAGLMSEAQAKVDRKALRLSTIDNYQGEESDIVIVSLTRSNADGDIGFLNARERLVVLMSRARNGMVLFGNMFTFMKSNKGGEMWKEYFDLLKEQDCLFEGVPVRCERHPDNTSPLLKSPEEFDKYCPDGGCAEPCGVMLRCGKHPCPRSCHLVTDHSMISCEKPLHVKCARGHTRKVTCGNPGGVCDACNREDEIARQRIRRDLELEGRRLETQEKYRQELQEIEDALHHEQQQSKYEAEEKIQAESLEKKRKELSSLRDANARRNKVKEEQAQKKSSQPSTAQVPKDPKTANGDPGDGSKARAEWEAMKKMEGSHNDALDSLMSMIGLESVKRSFLTLQSGVDTKIRQGVDLEQERYSCSMLGNPGTGKTTVARLYGKFLTSVGAIPGGVFTETSGSKLASDGVSKCEDMLEAIKNAGGGVLFIDEAYQLSSGNSSGGLAVLDYILAEVENLRGKIVFVLAGYSRQMESFFAHNPGFPSRFPTEMKFEDYTDKELHKILQQKVHTKYNGRMNVAEGPEGLFFRIASRRVGYIRGKEGFGNARAIENFVQLMTNRQAERIRLLRLAGKPTNDLFLTKEDIIGPEPTDALTKSKAFQDLNKLIGLKEVKEVLKVLLDTVKANYLRENAEEPLVEFSLNRVFLGSPGTGKTTVAKLFGQILVDLGLLSNGEVVIKNPSDFVGAYVGHSEKQTKAILAATVGKVLVIDEAYGLCDQKGGGIDSFKAAVIDTIVAEVQSVPGEDRCVLLLGYQDQMEKMFQTCNPGLSRRFPLSSAFVFNDFNDDELVEILSRKLQSSGFKATEEAKKVALDVLRLARRRPNFGNAGEVDILLGRAKESHQKRYSSGESKRRTTLEAIDFDPDYDRAEKGTDVKKLFMEDIGREKIIALLEGYQKRAKDAKKLEMDPEIPFNFLFRGPSGVGKTTTARKMGKVYYDMGLLAKAELIECSTTDLIGSYVGHTGPKVQQLFEKALGKILFIDEAYRLSGSHFAKEALDEIVDCVTKPKFHNKLIIIMAGYDKDINSLLSANPGLSSRFPEVIDFAPLNVEDCVKLMTSKLREKKKMIEDKGKTTFDISCLEFPRMAFEKGIERKLRALMSQEGWANARDVIQLAKETFHGVDLDCEPYVLSEDGVNYAMDYMIYERTERAINTTKSKGLNGAVPLAASLGSRPVPPVARTTGASTQDKKNDQNPNGKSPDSPKADKKPQKHPVRDAGVSDDVWEQLQRDREREEKEKAEHDKLLEAEKNARDAERERLVKQIIAEEEHKKKIEQHKARLMKSGCCPRGYAWTKQQGGYRCAGGAHWVPDCEVEKMS
ncbi:P-loop containing nucleoside triphosphate hydrolase protein [Thelonectria olida]|uniref:P-loop containing nucleoside triphosphate hydrolase protein n=1 Tax=Thelonectria olida TaxID=1576542 RepID=A0A9P8W7C4_9HYPO|nr:P-loop containing nucleoside triphosphate hydrolase protein [Thelonectria olida]